MTALLLLLILSAMDFFAAEPVDQAGLNALNFLFTLPLLVGMAGVFQKAEKPWYAAFVPVWSDWVLLKVVGWSGWMMLLLLLPFASGVIFIVASAMLAGQFRKDTSGIVLMIFLPFLMLPMLGFGSDKYFPPGTPRPRRRRRLAGLPNQPRAES